MPTAKGSLRRILLVAAAAVTVVSLAACGSSSTTSTPTTASTSSTPAASSTNLPYNGPEKGLPTSYGTVLRKPGTHCVIGYQDLYAEQLSLSAQTAGAEKEAARLGCAIDLLNDNLSLTTQVSDFADLLAKKVSAIVVYPLVPSGLQPSINQAKAAHIPVIAQQVPVDPGQPTPSGYATSILQGFDFSAYSRAKNIAAADPGASFVVQGLAAPVAALEYLAVREKYWGEKFGLKFLGEVDNQTDTPAGYIAAMTGIVAKYPTVKAVMCYTDDCSVADAGVVKSSGKSGILLSAQTGSPSAYAAIKAGTVFDTYQPDWQAVGQLSVDAAYDLITKQNLPLPKITVVKWTVIDKSNVDSNTPVSDK
jgi:ribose transport system substrate-binding protein